MKMKTKNKLIITAMALVAIVTMTLALFACEEEDPKCTCPNGKVHPYGQPCQCEGKGYGCNCTEAEQPRELSESYDIVLKSGTLKFVVNYKRMSNEPVPVYLTYLETRLGVVANSTSEESIESVNYLMSKGSQFTIDVESTGSIYADLIYVADKSFKVHKGWISTASGSDLSSDAIRRAFDAVAMLKPNARDTIRMAKAPVDTKAKATVPDTI
jgi:hypothetical protein